MSDIGCIFEGVNNETIREQWKISKYVSVCPPWTLTIVWAYGFGQLLICLLTLQPERRRRLHYAGVNSVGLTYGK